MKPRFEDSPPSWTPSNENVRALAENALGTEAPILDETLESYPSTAWRDMMVWVRRIAPTRLPVLVRGESGSGKERVSSAIHALSSRRHGPFVAINCTALPETLLESELFGVVRGAYTGSFRDRPGLFVEAHRGTLFLDEIGDMAPPMQAKLLRVLESGRVRPVGSSTEKSVDVRIVAATHCDLASFVRDGRFRPDLYHRLAVLCIDVPALRSRMADLTVLIDALAPRLTRETGYASVRIAPDAWAELRAHAWPGNIRELHAVIARALLRADGGEVGAEHLDLPLHRPSRPHPAPESLERTMIETALRDARGSIARAASRIGWSRQKLYRRMSALAVDRPAR